MEFTQLTTYIESKTTIQGRITAINTCIDSIFPLILRSLETGDKQEYLVDNGQSKILLKYRDPLMVTKLITVLEAQKQYYINQLNGRVMRSIDTKNLQERWY